MIKEVHTSLLTKWILKFKSSAYEVSFLVFHIIGINFCVLMCYYQRKNIRITKIFPKVEGDESPD